MNNIDEIIKKHEEIEKINLITITDITAILVQEHKVIKDLLNYIKDISKGE